MDEALKQTTRSLEKTPRRSDSLVGALASLGYEGRLDLRGESSESKRRRRTRFLRWSSGGSVTGFGSIECGLKKLQFHYCLWMFTVMILL